MKWTLIWEMVLIVALATVFMRDVAREPPVMLRLPSVIRPGLPANQIHPVSPAKGY